MYVNREKLADLIGCSLRTIDEYCRQGMPGEPPKRKGDQWRFESSAVVGWLRERERQSALGEIAQVDEADARRRKLAAEAAMAELELAKAEGHALSVSDWGKAAAAVVGAARAKLLGLGSKLGPIAAVKTDAAECATAIDEGIAEALEELSEFEPDIQIDPEGDPEPEGGDPEGSSAVGSAPGPDRQRVGRRRAATQSRVKR